MFAHQRFRENKSQDQQLHPVTVMHRLLQKNTDDVAMLLNITV